MAFDDITCKQNFVISAGYRNLFAAFNRLNRLDKLNTNTLLLNRRRANSPKQDQEPQLSKLSQQTQNAHEQPLISRVTTARNL